MGQQTRARTSKIKFYQNLLNGFQVMWWHNIKICLTVSKTTRFVGKLVDTKWAFTFSLRSFWICEFQLFEMGQQIRARTSKIKFYQNLLNRLQVMWMEECLQHFTLVYIQHNNHQTMHWQFEVRTLTVNSTHCRHTVCSCRFYLYHLSR
jgi:hypothetical protein